MAKKKNKKNKKEKKVIEPKYISSALNTPMLNYKVYYMTLKEKIITFLMAFAVGGFAGWVFYGNQFLDDYGQATPKTGTANIIIFCAFGILASIIYFPMRKKSLLEKRKMELTMQFRSFLDSLSVSLSSGMNMTDSLQSISVDLRNEFSDNSYIVKEVREMIIGMQNNIEIESMLESLGNRSEIEDIKNFGTVFAISYRAGGNLKDIVRRTNNILSQKLEIKQEINTALSSNQMQFKVMMVIPIVMMLLLRVMSSSFAASFSTIPGIVSVTIAIGFFFGAYKMGSKIMDVEGA